MTLLAGGLVDIGDFADTGWVNRAADLESGFSELDSLDSRRIGNVVYWRGRIEPDTDWGAAQSNNNVFADVGSMWTPDQNHGELSPASTNDFSDYFRVVLTSSGTMQVRFTAASQNNPVFITLRYIVDSPFTL